MYDWKDCQKAQQSSNLFVRFFGCAPVEFDRWVRLGDFYFNRSFGGWLRRLIGEGFSPLAFLVPAFLLFFIVFGPIPNVGMGEGWLWFLVSLAGLVATFWLAERFGRPWLAALQMAWVFLICLAVWFRGAETQASGGMYIHLLLAAVVLLLPAGLGLARWISRRITKGLSNDWAAQLPTTELFESPPFPKIDGGTILRSLIHAPLQRPVATLLLPAIGFSCGPIHDIFGGGSPARSPLPGCSAVSRAFIAAWMPFGPRFGASSPSGGKASSRFLCSCWRVCVLPK